jgi:hypothetical protein
MCKLVTLQKTIANNFVLPRNEWIQTMQTFASNLANICSSVKLPTTEVRVAILDDGIDWFFAKETKCSGQTFYASRDQGHDGRKPWYASSTDHGTLMAALVRKICPEAKLYIARLDQTKTDKGRFQPTAASAAKVSN